MPRPRSLQQTSASKRSMRANEPKLSGSEDPARARSREQEAKSEAKGNCTRTQHRCSLTPTRGTTSSRPTQGRGGQLLGGETTFASKNKLSSTYGTNLRVLTFPSDSSLSEEPTPASSGRRDQPTPESRKGRGIAHNTRSCHGVQSQTHQDEDRSEEESEARHDCRNGVPNKPDNRVRRRFLATRRFATE